MPWWVIWFVESVNTFLPLNLAISLSTVRSGLYAVLSTRRMNRKIPDLNSLTLYVGVVCPHPLENEDAEKKNETSSRQIGGRSCGKGMENAVNRCTT